MRSGKAIIQRIYYIVTHPLREGMRRDGGFFVGGAIRFGSASAGSADTTASTGEAWLAARAPATWEQMTRKQ